MNERLKELANLYNPDHELDEDMSPDDYAGGNIDDAFYSGLRIGENNVYKTIKEILDENEWNN